MKSFYVAERQSAERFESTRGELVEFPVRPELSLTAEQRASTLAPQGSSSSARIAIYDGRASAPRIDEVVAGSAGDLIDQLATRVYEHARAMGGSVPFSVVREVSENFIHAEFREPVVSVLDRGNTIRFSDQGPGFSDASRALEPGYTTATCEMKRFIRGVGSGLPLATECLAFRGGSLNIDSNLGAGAVVTVRIPGAADAPRVPLAGGSSAFSESPGVAETGSGTTDAPPAASSSERGAFGLTQSACHLTNRQKQVLALVMDSGSAGPSIVAKELSVGLSTAYRDLARLESLGLIVSDDTGKRQITQEGTAYLGGLLNGLF